MEKVEIIDVFNRFMRMPKLGDPELTKQVEEYIQFNRQLLSFMTTVFGWADDDPFKPDPDNLIDLERDL